MIRYIGPGLVVNAIVQAGFWNTHNHFDTAHFTKMDESGKIVRLAATFENVDNAHPSELGPVDNSAVVGSLAVELPPLMVQVAEALMQVNCKVHLLDARSRSDRAMVLFERLDLTPCLNRLMGTRVKVHGYLELRPGLVDEEPFSESGER